MKEGEGRTRVLLLIKTQDLGKRFGLSFRLLEDDLVSLTEGKEGRKKDRAKEGRKEPAGKGGGRD